MNRHDDWSDVHVQTVTYVAVILINRLDECVRVDITQVSAWNYIDVCVMLVCTPILHFSFSCVTHACFLAFLSRPDIQCVAFTHESEHVKTTYGRTYNNTSFYAKHNKKQC